MPKLSITADNQNSVSQYKFRFSSSGGALLIFVFPDDPAWTQIDV
jgi:hypothetical protein